MPRALSIQRSIVPAGDRAKYLERIRVKREHYKNAGCQFWVFEEAALSGAFIEFIEAPSAQALSAGHAASPGMVLDPSRIYTELEFT